VRRFVDPDERLHGQSGEGPGVRPIRSGTATAGSWVTALYWGCREIASEASEARSSGVMILKLWTTELAPVRRFLR
jgi:hypothetical protein